MARKKKISVGDYQEPNNNKKKKTIAREVVPEDLVIDNILTRLPFRSLARLSCVSKNWYRSIFNDARFTALHFANQQSNRKIVLTLFDISEQHCEESFCILELQQKTNDNKDVFADYKLLKRSYYSDPNELVGYCNGLFCVIALNRGDEEHGVVTVYNPALKESLTLTYLNPIEARGGEYLCHGFGFDSLSKQYKIVVIYTTTTKEADEEFVCMVYTSDVAEWKKIVTRTSEISPPPQPGSSSFQLPKRRSVTTAWREYCRSATLCGGDLYWRITKSLVINDDDDDDDDDYDDDDDNQEEMLLSFDINSEKIQFIRLPTECSTTTTRTPFQPDLVVDHHLLEFKGYPCVAISEKTMKNKRDRDSHHHRRDFHSCHFGVHMYVLKDKDKDKQVWTREEVFNVTFEDTVLSPLPRPFSGCCFENITATTPPTRILSFSDQVLLYWFDGEFLVYYSFKMNGLKVAKGSLSSGDKKIREIFEAKMKRISSGRNIHCPYIDYQLHAQMENIFSLKTFIPQGGGTIFEDPDDFTDFLNSDDNEPAGWLTTTRNNSEINEVFY